MEEILMETREVYSVLECTDKNEGRGAMVATGVYFKTESSAIDFITSNHYSKYAVMGVIPRSNKEASLYCRLVVISVYDDLNDYNQNSKEMVTKRLKVSALNKLTNEEKEALGL
jgi:hypothetical protein